MKESSTTRMGDLGIIEFSEKAQVYRSRLAVQIGNEIRNLSVFNCCLQLSTYVKGGFIGIRLFFSFCS
jgi:hypothetical protein